MNTRRLKIAFAATALILTISFAATTAYTVKRVLFPPWYASVQTSEFPPCSAYQKKVYVYCNDPEQDFQFTFESVEGRRPLAGNADVGSAPLSRDALSQPPSRVINWAGWLVRSPSPHPTPHLVILIHGAGADRRAMLKHVPYLRAAGYDTLLIDMHNHGLCPRDGRGISYGRYEVDSVLQAIEWAESKNYPAKNITLFGTSMGAFTSLYAASKLSDEMISKKAATRPNSPPDEASVPAIPAYDETRTTASVPPTQTPPSPLGGIIAENPYSDLRKVMAQYPLVKSMPSSILSTAFIILSLWHSVDYNELNASHFASKITVPVLLIHGTDDQLVPMEHSMDLIEQLSTKNLYLVAGGEHEALWNKDKVNYEQRILNFLETSH